MANSAFVPTLGSNGTHSLAQTSCMPHHSIRSDEQASGLKAIYASCRALYPDQPTPLQVTALRKYWMGGPDPLDFINMYANPGSVELKSPAHWHYVTNGLSDLYGDARLHNQNTTTEDPSGFGFELTLRVRRDATETSPPTWPAHLLQSIARYVFHSQAQLMVGDHIPWPTALDKQPLLNKSLEERDNRRAHTSEIHAQSIAVAAAATAASMLAADSHKDGDPQSALLANPSTYASMVAAAWAAVNSTSSTNSVHSIDNLKATDKNSQSSSRIHHMLVVEDPQLKKISTPYGYVQFLQLVGLCNEELRLVQRWTGTRVMELMCHLPETGGGLLVTDMRRKQSLFELEPNLASFVNEQLRREGSNLSGVTTQYFAWAPIPLLALGELLPGELEARRLRDLNRPRESSSISGCDSVTLSAGTNSRNPCLKNDACIKTDDTCLPTDLSMPRISDANSVRSPSPVHIAMDTDETVVSTVTKKVTDDDDFVDVVGDDADPPPLVPSTASSVSIAEMEDCDKECRQIEPHSPKTVPDKTNTTNLLAATNSSQSVSAPGRVSSWCSRLNPGTQHVPGELTGAAAGSLGFRAFNTADSASFGSSFQRSVAEQKGNHTPGSAGEGSAPCTPLAHLSLSPASLDLYPTRVVECLDVHLCREAAEMLPLAVNDRLRHRRHFTFLNANFPEHAITLVPTGVSGAFVSETSPYVARGPWLQILIPDDFLERLEFEFSVLTYADEVILPLVFRWPERGLRICLVDPVPNPLSNSSYTQATLDTSSLLPKAVSIGSPETARPWCGLPPQTNKHDLDCASPALKNPRNAQLPRPGTFGSSVDELAQRSHLFSHFPPGCVPPPAILANIFNCTPGTHPTDLRPCQPTDTGLSSSLSSSANISNVHAFQSAMKNWMQFYANVMQYHDTNRSSQSFSGMPETMQTALGTMQQSGGPHLLTASNAMPSTLPQTAQQMPYTNKRRM
ncbi:suppressor of fused [Paragonimus westermani]|uniref:Suppressor of fused n=1 Tax=Paragonimus westermani TaxID=34504 RepID=A0A5J4NG36_9TREM|nr:suppressor of fused [Paragonimus westermani]